MSESVVIGAGPLGVVDVVAVARDRVPVTLDPDAEARIATAREVVDRAAASDAPVYGINTGFGKLATVRIPADQVRDLQRNLVRSHASGVGAPLPVDVVRALMVLTLQKVSRPESGARPLVAQGLAALLNAGIHPVVPEQGSVGASGDLAPLSHLALALMGEGEVTTADGGPRRPAGEALRSAGIESVTYEAKEGLALVNGTQAQTAALVLLVHDLRNLWRTAHGAAALSADVLLGTPDAFDARLHAARPHPGQVASASLLRELLADSALRESHRTGDPRVQDAYCVRCTPQILGAVGDTLDYAERVADVEINAATDNPLVFDGEVLSGGNFHGQPVAFALDYLAVAVTALTNLAERRIDRLVNPDLSQGLPAFLATSPGLESGCMVVQIGAAALAAEARVLSTPASIQSIPTDANQEDIVPMSMAAALKARRVYDIACRVVAGELLCAAQALDYRRPLTSSPRLEALHQAVRRSVAPLAGDRSLADDLERLAGRVAGEAMV